MNKKKGLYLIFVGCILIQILILQGCAESSHSVIAATETTIGVNISQNASTQSPQAKLGYNRAELAIIPSNRSKGTDAGSIKNGASDVADVVMELRYGGIFDLGASSGIYQRLAVGKSAVSQPGATLMFAKDASGDLKPEAGNAVTKALSSQELFETQLSAVDKIFTKTASSGNADETKLKAFFKCNGHSNDEVNRLTDKYKGMNSNEFKKNFTKEFGWIAHDYSQKCAK